MQKTYENIFSKLDKLINTKDEIDDEFLENLEEILISSDIGVLTSEKIIESLKKRVKEEKFELKDQPPKMLCDEIYNVIAVSNGAVTELFKMLLNDYFPF